MQSIIKFAAMNLDYEAMKLWSVGGREFDTRPGHYVVG